MADIDLSYLPIRGGERSIEERAIGATYRPFDNALISPLFGITHVDSELENYLIYRAALEEKIGDLALVGGIGYADDGRGLMLEYGADYPLTNNLFATYRHHSAPFVADDGSDFLGLTYRF